jgi:hypothetical protein
MEAFPELDIYFPNDQESRLIDAMKKRANGQWQWRPHGPGTQSVKDGQYFFHRVADKLAPASTLYLARKAPGHLWVPCFTSDTTDAQIPWGNLPGMIQDFCTQIADPAANIVDGYCSVGTSTHTLEDYFSSESIALLQGFCTSSNAGDLGTHPRDQERWMAFVIHHYRNRTKRVAGDVFGELLRDKEWWPEYGIPRLVREFDFAMRLLEQAEQKE